MGRTRVISATALTLPLVLCTVSLLEDLATYKVRQHVHGLHLRVAVILALNGVAFAAAATWLSPFIKGLLTKMRAGTRKGAGTFGLWLFFACAYGAMYFAYMVVERRGSGGLLPASMR